MMDMTVKEAVLKMQKYFMKQDHEQLARLCANLLVDINREFTKKELSDIEKLNLEYRTHANLTEVYKFLMSKRGSMKGLFLRNLNTDDEEEK